MIQLDDDRTAPMAQQLPEKQANFLLPDIVEVKLIVQAHVLSARTYGDSGNDRDLVAVSLAMIVKRNNDDLAMCFTVRYLIHPSTLNQYEAP